MKNIFTSFLVLIFAVMSYQASAQTSLYTQNFDASTSLPMGWSATPNSWYIDSGNASAGYTGASGHYNLTIRDTSATQGNDSLISAPIATTGYKAISLDWGTRFSKHFADSGSTVSLYWSVNGGAWSPISFTEDSNNSNWALDNRAVAITLPQGANNQASLQLMWVADIHFTLSGTYRIDDVTVSGTAIPSGINDIDAAAPFAQIFASSNSIINISVRQPLSEGLNVSVYDMTGRMVTESNMTSQVLTIDASNFSKGLYLVKVSDSDRSVTGKVVIR